MNIVVKWFAGCIILLSFQTSFAQTAYFADGYHGGIYGHIPEWQTRFMVDKLNQYPDWRINLELEPESWDTIKRKDLSAYLDFRKLMTDQTAGGRVEYVNPTYGQSYMYNISGESVIRQFQYGMAKLREHFPEIRFTTYSVEEPCFTSAMPGILISFGIKYAVLKNPNTCWGGYARAFDGELVNWTGPDGTKIITVPRYRVEALKPNSAWETIAASNSSEYIHAALNDGMVHPVGMCYQDAGWKNGPWLGDGQHSYQPSEYTTWRHYFEDISANTPRHDLAFSQEDVLVGLVWGAQVLQRIAQQVRYTENKLVTTEKIAALNHIYNGSAWPKSSFDEAWKNLLLAQHHDCWIVPYNGKANDTWADKVVKWTGRANFICDSITNDALVLLAGPLKRAPDMYVRVFNTLAISRNEVAIFPLPANNNAADMGFYNEQGKEILSQVVSRSGSERKDLLFLASVPSLGFATCQLKKKGNSSAKGANVTMLPDSTCKVETDLYQIVMDPSKGGSIVSFVAKQLDNKEFVDKGNERRFNEIRGNFYGEGGFRSSTETRASLRILENGPLRIKVAIDGMIANHPFTQILTAVQGQKSVDLEVTIDWKGNTGIGEFEGPANYKAEEPHKAFYDDRFKLLTLFPLNLVSQKVYKNAPFDVLESKLNNTFFNRWDSIKNNVILNWVDVTDGDGKYGMAVFSDHTTSYAHGQDYPLGLTLQYSGGGLFFRNYKLDGPTHVTYAMLPHAGLWNKSEIWTEGEKINEPLMAAHIVSGPSKEKYPPLIEMNGKGWELTSMIVDGNDLLIRVFNAEGNDKPQKIIFGCEVDKVMPVELSGSTMKELKMEKEKGGKMSVTLAIPRFGIRTIKVIRK
jgi:alpha-mannosidase